MTKKLWIMLLTLMLCLGALCAETGAKAVGASETQQPSSAAKVEYAFGRGTAVRYLDTLEEAFRWIYNTSGTITLLKDVEISTPLQITPGNVWDGTVLNADGEHSRNRKSCRQCGHKCEYGHSKSLHHSERHNQKSFQRHWALSGRR